METQQDRDNQLIAFIEEISKAEIDVDARNHELLEKLKSIYLDQNGKDVHRHSYARLSHYFYREDLDPEAISICVDKLDQLAPYVNCSANEGLQKAYRKLIDHVKLEQIHLGQMNAIKMATIGIPELLKNYSDYQSKMDTINNTFEQQQKNIDDAKNSLGTLNEDLKSQNIQTVTVLGIFSGIVFAFSGGFTMLGSAFGGIQNIQGVQTLFFLAMALAIGVILYDVIFSLLCFIGHLNDKEPDKIKNFTIAFNGAIALLVVILMIVYFWIYNTFQNQHAVPDTYGMTEQVVATPEEPAI